MKTLPPNLAGGPPGYVAHTPSKTNPHWHLLADHTLAVARMARDSASALGYGAGDVAYYLGLLHDLGKFTPAFQSYLWQNHLADRQEAPRPAKGSAPHKQYGAVAAMLLDPVLGRLWQLPLQGHHGGMKSRDATGSDICRALGVENTARLDAPTRDLLALAAATDPRLAATLPDAAAFLASPLTSRDPEARELFVRLLFSCLVDADARDTEAHGTPDKAPRRAGEDADFAALLRALETAQEGFAGATGVVAEVRRQVYDACRQVGSTTSDGFYTLTVPTGGGKTRSSLAFALEQAVARHKRRVVYALPYTSIIDQTADVFRAIFGEDTHTVLEHHSAVGATTRAGDGEEDRVTEAEAWRLLAAEDWGAPLIVTTTVQLFESLFARTPAACRKLHRLAGSVLILDEVQCLPAHLLAPIRSVLKSLVEYFNVTVVLCTATQPAHDVASKWMRGITATPIVPDPAPHFAALRRVTWTVPDEAWDFARLAKELRSKPDVSTLCVLNTRKQAQDTIKALRDAGESPGAILHLSTLLCPMHRRAVIAEVRGRVKPGGKPVILVSTQVIEAGVDLSFARMFRAMGPLERIIQAAGRCNREGEWGERGGEAVVFTPADEAAPKGWYSRCLQATKNLLARGGTDFDDPAFVTAYFAEMYGGLEAEADARKIGAARCNLQYDYVAEHFRMIDKDTVSVFVTGYKPENDPDAPARLLHLIEHQGIMTRELWRQAQPFVVSLPAYAVSDAAAPEVVPGLRVWAGEYDPLLGVVLQTGGEVAINLSDLYLCG